MPCGSSGNADGCVTYRYSVYVLEAATSNRLTYFLPPLVSFMYFCLLNAPLCTANNAVALAGNGCSSEVCTKERVGRLAHRQALLPHGSLLQLQAWPQIGHRSCDHRIIVRRPRIEGVGLPRSSPHWSSRVGHGHVRQKPGIYYVWDTEIAGHKLTSNPRIYWRCCCDR